MQSNTEVTQAGPMHSTADRLAAMADALEQTVRGLEQRIEQKLDQCLDRASDAESGQLDQIVATVDSSNAVAIDAASQQHQQHQQQKIDALECRLAEVERQLATSLQANAATATGSPANLNSGRKTISASAASLLAKHGVGEGPVEAATLDAALTSLPVEQRIAVKSQLLRAGLLG